MPETAPGPRRRELLRFSVFELDLRTGELRKAGRRVRLSGQPLKLLERLLARPGDLVTREELQRELWSDDTFVDFERNLNSAIKRLRGALGDSADVPRFIETLPRRGYRFLVPVERVADAVAAGAPGPDGSHQPTGSPSADPVQRSRRVPWPVIAVGLGLAAAAALVLTAWPQKRQTDVRTIAVLPFVQPGAGSSADEYLAFGLTEALSKELSRLDNLRVISQTTSQQYRDAGKTLPQIAAELGVDVVLEGSVQREGSRIRITVQLIDAADDTHLWAESYEREIGSVLALADEVARAVTREIHGQVAAKDAGPRVVSRDVDTRVAEAYLKGRYHLGKGTEADSLRGSSYFEQALAIDSSHAPSHSGLADYYILNDALKPEEAFPRARLHALRAIELDETLPDAHASLAFLRYYDQWDWGGAEQEFKRAIELNPGHVRARRWYGLFLSAMGRHADALDQAQRARAIDPVAITNLDALAMIQFNARQYRESVATGRGILELDAFDTRGYEHQALGLIQLGEHAEALALIDKALPLAASSTVLKLIRIMCLGRAARTAEAERELGLLEGLAERQYVPTVLLAIARSDLGHGSRALEHLEAAYAQRDPYLVLLNVSPWFDPVREDPRFRRLLERLAFPEASPVAPPS